MTDIIEDFIKAVRDINPEFADEHGQQLEQQFRKEWGGVENKPAKRAPMLRRAREKVMQQIGNIPDAEIAREHGISRRTLYRWIKK